MSITYLWAKLFRKIRGSALKNCSIHSSSKIESGCNCINVKMGRHSFCGYDCEISNVEIGSFCSIANNVIIGGGMHPMDWVSTSPVFYEGRDSVKAKFATHEREPIKRTVIGHDVWIGQYALIKQGIIIGTGAVIGMGSVVTKNVDPYTVVAGCPIKIIKKRFDDKICSDLLESKWWDFSDKQLSTLGKLFNSPQEFLNNIGK